MLFFRNALIALSPPKPLYLEQPSVCHAHRLAASLLGVAHDHGSIQIDVNLAVGGVAFAVGFDDDESVRLGC